MNWYSSLILHNFRSYGEYSLELEPGVNIIVGPNGSGKTNLLEALYVISAGSSFRGTDRELVRHGNNWFKLEGWYGKNQRALTYRLTEDGRPEKHFLLDETRKARLTHDLKIPVVLFEPEHLRLLKASPSHRRTYLDDLLSKLQPDFPRLKNQFERVLLQRNNVLKHRLSAKQRADHLFAWNVRFVELASQIVTRRLELAGLLDSRLAKVYSQIARHPHKAQLKYQNSVPGKDYAAALLAELEGSVARDAERGFTGAGPQRDDFWVTLDGAPAATAASRGELRSLVLALKIIELELLAGQHASPPLLLLDDVFSELDGERRRSLAELAKTHQTIITTTDADSIVAHFLSGYKVIATTKG